MRRRSGVCTSYFVQTLSRVADQLPEAGSRADAPFSPSEAVAEGTRLSMIEFSASVPWLGSTDSWVDSDIGVVATTGLRICSSPMERISKWTRRFTWRQ